MPLLDHFHAPVYPHHRWEAFHARWAGALSDELNRILPPRFLASNKHDEAERRSFAGKCAAYLKRGVGLIVVDIVSSRRANLHRELFDLLEQPAATALIQTDLYATAYRPHQRGGQGHLDMWAEGLTVGRPLRLLPLALRGAFIVPVNLEATYMETRQHSRL